MEAFNKIISFCGFFLIVLVVLPTVTAYNFYSESPYANMNLYKTSMMFRANAEHTGVFDNSGIIPTNTELWQFDTGGEVPSSPAVAGGIVYIGSKNNTLFALDAVTGEEKWRFVTGGSLASSSPAVSGGIVYIGCDDNNLYAVDAATGAEKWRFATRGAVTSSPAVSNGVVYFGSDDQDLYAVDAVTGAEKWRFGTGGDVRSSPAVLNGVVYVGSFDHFLYAIDAMTGVQKWKYPASGNWIASSPAVSNGVVYVGSYDSNLYAIDAATGHGKWHKKLGTSVTSSPAVSDGIVYVGSFDNNLYAFNAITGTEKWRFSTGNKVYSSPAVSNGTVYIGSWSKNLYAIDAATGMEKWRFATGGTVASSPAVSNGVVYFGSDDNNLYAVGERTTSPVISHEAVSSTPLPSQAVLSTPGIQSTIQPSSSPGSSNTDLTLPIIVVLVLMLVAGGGYAVYRMKRKPSADQTPAVVKKENRGEQPLPTAPVSRTETRPSYEYLLNQIATVEQKSSVLPHYGKTVQALILKAQEQYRSGAYDAVQRTLSTAEDAITSLAPFENRLWQWKNEGYPTTSLELLKTENIATVTTAFRDFEHDLEVLRQQARRVQELRLSFDREYPDPKISQRIDALEPHLKDPRNIAGINQEVDAIHRELQDRQEKKKLKDNAEQQLSKVKDTLATLRMDGAVVKDPTDEIHRNITEGRYGDAIIAAKNALTGLTRVQAIYQEAKALSTAISEPSVLELFKTGKYEEFIHATEDWQDRRRALAEKKERAMAAAIDFEKFGRIPKEIQDKIVSENSTDIENGIRDLNVVFASAQPALTLGLDQTRLAADKWHKVGVQITNNGDAHAFDVSFSFSSEFETRWIKPTNIEARKSKTVDIGILPKKEGNIPLEITVHCRDGHNKTYEITHEFWIDVVDRMTLAPEKDAASTQSQSPVSRFTPRPLTPKQLPLDLSDRYTESEFIGKGGFARVFKAKRKDGKYVAVKIPISLDASTGKSFIAEMQNWTLLNHPNIVKLYDFNIMPVPYFEMELCDSSLADRKKPIECDAAAWILFNVCEGLKFTHAHRIIHRDIKPQNILLKNGIPKISDWGLSRVISESTSTSATSFTAYYAAPEQIGNKPKDERTDIWQLGVILYELVTGVLPFTGDSMLEIGMSIATKDPTPPSKINPGSMVLDAVVMKCLQKDPSKRYQSVLLLQKDLALFLRENYAELLQSSVSVQDFTRSAFYCGDLIMVNLQTGDIPTAFKYLLDLAHYSQGEVKAEAQEVADQIKIRMEVGITEIPDELIQKAEILVHKVTMGFRNRNQR